jgi:hypothetical protein
VAWGALALGRQIAPPFEDRIGLLTIIHGGVVALMSGSLASAEEREFGTLESQVLLPMATWEQWAVKAGMALGLTLLLGAGLPALLGNLDPSADSIRVNPSFTGVMVLFTAASLYVSSLCASGIRAILGSIFVIIVTPLLLRSLAVFRLFHSVLPPGRLLPEPYMVPAAAALGAGLVVLLLRFGLVNHRSSERGVRPVWQASWIVAWVTLGVVILSS